MAHVWLDISGWAGGAMGSTSTADRRDDVHRFHRRPVQAPERLCPTWFAGRVRGSIERQFSAIADSHLFSIIAGMRTLRRAAPRGVVDFEVILGVSRRC